MTDSHKTLRALLRLKSLSTTMVARATGIPKTNIELFLSGRSMVLSEPAVSRIASIAGLDVSEGVLTSDRVHVLHVGVGPLAGKHADIDELEVVSFAIHTAKMAKVEVAGLARMQLFAVQNDAVRVLVVAHHAFGFGGDVGRKVNLRLGVSPWARGSEESSVIKTTSHISDLVRNDNMLSIDFDDIFVREQKVSFQDVQHVARGRGLSSQDLLNLIEHRPQPNVSVDSFATSGAPVASPPAPDRRIPDPITSSAQSVPPVDVIESGDYPVLFDEIQTRPRIARRAA